MIALYGHDDEHPQSCTCAACAGVEILADLDTRFVKIPAEVTNDYLEAVYGQLITTTDLHEGLWREYYERLKNHAEAGWGKRFNDVATTQEWEFTQRIERNLREFAAHKQATITSELRRLLVGPKGKRSQQDWLAEAERVIKRHHGRYLRAELSTATAAAQAAESWQEFERRKYLYQNLKYITAGDERVRESHRLLDNIVRPVDDPFWDTHTPPLGWLCRCKLIQTDEASTGVPDLSEVKIPKGLRQNPGKTGKLFGDDHPYFNHSELDVERISANAARLHAKESRQAVRQWAKDQDLSIKLPHLDLPVGMTNGEVKTVTGKPHRESAGRNELLYILGLLADKLQYLGSAPDSGEHATVRSWHYYSISLGGVDFFINIWRHVFDDQTERLGIHAITDTKPDFGGP